MLKVKDINVYYGKIHALKNVSFEVRPGEVVALIGANGAGKSTTLNLIAGAIPADQGTIRLDGVDLTRLPEHKRAKYLGLSLIHI